MRCAFLIAAVATTACKKTEPSTIDNYTYSVDAGHLPNSAGFAVSVNGKAAGTARSFTVPREIYLSDPQTKIELSVPTTCGTERVTLVSESGDRNDEEQRRHASLSLQSSGGPATMAQREALAWRVDVTTPIRESTVYFDNRFSDTEAAFQIGSHKVSVAARGEITDVIRVGTCASARDLAITGRAVGQVPPPNPNGAYLIASQADQCYVKGYAEYVKMESDTPPCNAPCGK